MANAQQHAHQQNISIAWTLHAQTANNIVLTAYQTYNVKTVSTATISTNNM